MVVDGRIQGTDQGASVSPKADRSVTRPVGFSGWQSYRVRQAMIAGRPVQDPGLRPLIDYHLPRLDRAYERTERTAWIWYVSATIWVLIAVVDLVTGHRGWFSVIRVVTATLAVAAAITMNPLSRRRQARLDRYRDPLSEVTAG